MFVEENERVLRREGSVPTGSGSEVGMLTLTSKRIVLETERAKGYGLVRADHVPVLLKQVLLSTIIEVGVKRSRFGLRKCLCVGTRLGAYEFEVEDAPEWHSMIAKAIDSIQAPHSGGEGVLRLSGSMEASPSGD